MIDPVFRHLRSVGVRVDVGAHYLIARCDHAVLAAAMREAGATCDALITDPPYSARTHEGHDDGTAQANRVLSWAKGREKRGQARKVHNTVEKVVARTLRAGAERREIDYPAWAASDVDAFVGVWSPLAGWLVVMSDHVLGLEWERAAGEAYRYAFAPIACVEVGSRVRLDGTGPPQWATFLYASRPRSREWLDAWHAKRWAHDLAPRGGYAGGAEKKDVSGGKPLWLMRAIVGDYSAPGDLVCDPCMGAGTTLVAAIELGRRAIGCEPDAGRYAMALARVSAAREQTRLRLDVEAKRGEQATMDLGGKR